MEKLDETRVSNNLTVHTSFVIEYFETMVCDEDFDEIEVLRTEDKKEALKNHAQMVKKYTVSDEILNLCNLLKKGNEIAQEYSNIEDGGACNFDKVMINLKDKNKDYIQKIIDNSGFVLSKYVKGYYFVNFNLKGQGLRRTTMVQKATEFLQENGIDAQVYYQLD